MRPNRSLRIALMLEGLTGRELARRTNLREATISKIMTGRVIPREYEKDRIARVIGRPVEELFGQDAR